MKAQGSADPRLPAAERLLVESGIAGGSVRVEGHQDEIVVLKLPDAAWRRLVAGEGAGVVGALKELGFRYVSLDLDTADAGE